MKGQTLLLSFELSKISRGLPIQKGDGWSLVDVHRRDTWGATGGMSPTPFLGEIPVWVLLCLYQRLRLTWLTFHFLICLPGVNLSATWLVKASLQSSPLPQSKTLILLSPHWLPPLEWGCFFLQLLKLTRLYYIPENNWVFSQHLPFEESFLWWFILWHSW